MASYCIYQASNVPVSCNLWFEGDTVMLTCAEPCTDVFVTDVEHGCQGTFLVSYDESCIDPF